MPFDWVGGMAEVRREARVWPASRTYPAVEITMLATTPPVRQAIRSASTRAGTSPIAPKASASNANVVVARRSVANATKHHRENASTAQNRNNPSAAWAQSITKYPPGV